MTAEPRLIWRGPLETERLVVRLVAESDLPALLEVNSSEEVTAMLPYATWHSRDDAEAWLRRMQGIQATGKALQLVVVSKSIGAAIGTCLLFQYEPDNGYAELGYVLGRRHWGQGYMQEALRSLISHAFQTMHLRRLEAHVIAQNRASARLLERLGFTREGLLRQRWQSKGGIQDCEIYGLLAGD